MAIKNTSKVKEDKSSPKKQNEASLKAIIQMINIQRDTNMTRVYSAILACK